MKWVMVSMNGWINIIPLTDWLSFLPSQIQSKDEVLPPIFWNWDTSVEDIFTWILFINQYLLKIFFVAYHICTWNDCKIVVLHYVLIKVYVSAPTEVWDFNYKTHTRVYVFVGLCLDCHSFAQLNPWCLSLECII